jgi:hypothetical protein
VEALCAAAEVLVGVDWADLDEGCVPLVVGSLARVWRVVEASVAHGMGVMARDGVTERGVGLPAANWWVQQGLGHGGQGAWLVRAGDLMEVFPAVGAAVRAGELCVEHLRVLDEVRDETVLGELLGADAELCAVGVRASMANWRREVRRRVEWIRVTLAERDAAERAVAERAAADEPGDCPAGGGSGAPGEADDDDPRDDPVGGRCGEAGRSGSVGGDGLFDWSGDGGPASGSSGQGAGGDLDSGGLSPGSGAAVEGWLSWRGTAGGALVLRGELQGVDAELARQILTAELSRQRRAAWLEHDATGVAMPTTGQLRARALLQLLRDAGCGSGPSGSHSAGVGRTEAVVVIEADDPTAQRVRSLDGEPVSAELAAVLSCDAHLQALVVDRVGQPLWLGRSTRLASAVQRRVLAVRDGGCVFPGCDAPPEWCDAHHQPGWSRGGRSDPEHLVLLCRRHHGTAHSRHWQLRPAEPEQLAARGDRSDGLGRASPPARSDVPASQRFEWVDLHTGTITPAQQRGLRGPPTR